MSDALERARDATARQAWAEAYAAFEEAHEEGPLDPESMERFADAAYLTGREAEASELYERAHRAFLDDEHVARSIRSLFWAMFIAIVTGEHARGGGLLARATRLCEEHGVDGPERALLALPPAVGAMESGDPRSALELFGNVLEAGRDANDPMVLGFARLGTGQCLVDVGDIDEGMALLDELMLDVTAGEVPPVLAGLIYCAAIDACVEINDLHRASEWTAALSDWCERQPSLVPYRGQCLVHRSQIAQIHGDWDGALTEALHARDRLSDPPGPAMGAAIYQLAEVLRVRGSLDEAELNYKRAAEHGHSPHPGLALLRLAQGDVAAAAAAIRRELDEATTATALGRLLPAGVEIMLAAGDVPAARAAANRLREIAEHRRLPLVEARAASALGSVLLAEGDARGALTELRSAWGIWSSLNAPYEAARTKADIAAACRALGDADTADVELEAARAALAALGAAPALAVLDGGRGELPDGLTAREAEVLALVSAGKTNRAIAEALVISEKTVARHLSNIFIKIGVSSRAAATAYAYQNGLVESPPT